MLPLILIGRIASNVNSTWPSLASESTKRTFVICTSFGGIVSEAFVVVGGGRTLAIVECCGTNAYLPIKIPITSMAAATEPHRYTGANGIQLESRSEKVGFVRSMRRAA